jgi:DNA-binding NarL/FixJ family response regulator
LQSQLLIVEGISVLVVDDHALFADALQARLSREPDLAPVSVAYDAEQLRARLAESQPAVVVLDLMLGEASGLDLAQYIRDTSPDTRVVMLTGVESAESVMTALTRGARAWLPKTIDTDHLVRVIRGVRAGEVWVAPDLLGQVMTDLVQRTGTQQPDPLEELTVREREVLQCLVDGMSRAEIASHLAVSVNTVRTHTQNLMGKLGAHSTLESVSLALRHGLRATSH